MSIINISQIEKYEKKKWNEKFAPKVKKTLTHNNEIISRIIENNTPTLKEYIEINEYIPNIYVIDDAVKHIQKEQFRTWKVFSYKFNWKLIYSDKTIDENYLIITWKTKLDYTKWEKKNIRDYKIETKKLRIEAQKKIPEWIKRWNNLIDINLQDEWRELVQKRVNDLYIWQDINDVLDIMEAISNWDNIEEIRKLINFQWHSWDSETLAFKAINYFGNEDCKRIINKLVNIA